MTTGAGPGDRYWSTIEPYWLLSEAMSYFGDQYPRERTARVNRLPGMRDQSRESWDPFASFDNRFFTSTDATLDRWQHAADAYAMNGS
jgi:hypothetical protein